MVRTSWSQRRRAVPLCYGPPKRDIRSMYAFRRTRPTMMSVFHGGRLVQAFSRRLCRVHQERAQRACFLRSPPSWCVGPELVPLTNISLFACLFLCSQYLHPPFTIHRVECEASVLASFGGKDVDR
eukprot:365674-Chlamydomonas_euryale.AAC.12